MARFNAAFGIPQHRIRIQFCGLFLSRLQLEADPRGSAYCLPTGLVYFRITVIERAVITFVSPS